MGFKVKINKQIRRKSGKPSFAGWTVISACEEYQNIGLNITKYFVRRRDTREDQFKKKIPKDLQINQPINLQPINWEFFTAWF